LDRPHRTRDQQRPHLCPGGTYVQFDLDGLLRADAKTRADTDTQALNGVTG
jgi:hypothetical protein